MTATRPIATSNVAVRGRGASAKVSGVMGTEPSCTCGCSITAAESVKILEASTCGP